MAHQRCDILIYQKFDRLPPQLQEFLHIRGFSSQIVTEPMQIIRTLEHLKDPVLLVDGGSSELSTRKCVDELLALKAVHSTPVLIVGESTRQFDGILNEHFCLAVTINAPCSNADILESVTYIVDTYERVRSDWTSHSSRKQDGPVSSEALSIPQITSPSAIQEIYAKFSSVPNLFFDQLDSSGLARVSMNGAEYIRATINEEYLVSHGYVTSDSLVLKAIQETLTGAEKWNHLHLCRSAFVAHQLIASLGLPRPLVDDTVSASILSAASMAPFRSEKLRINYLRPGRSILRKELCSRIKDSVMQLSPSIGNHSVSDIVLTMARLVGEEEFSVTNDVLLAASAVMAGDLTDRICYQRSVWDPRSASTLLRRIKQGAASEMHPQILCCLIKFLTEAIAFKPWTMLLPASVRNDPALIEQARRIRDSVVNRDEVKVPIASLMPGMKLSQPLLAFDGRKILTEDLTLDQDLIWRIWQLAAVRPLNAPLVVISEN